jgi:hypothetical protein
MNRRVLPAIRSGQPITCVGYVVNLSLSLNLITNSNEEQVHAWAV